MVSSVGDTGEVTHLSLCTGYDGLGLALRQAYGARLRTLAYVEIEVFAVANLESKINKGKMDCAPIHTNVKTFPYSNFHNMVDVLSGGFPCQPFSKAGLRKADDDDRHLYPSIAEGITQCQPKLVFLENVPGITSALTRDGTPVLLHVLRDLEGRGYEATWGMYSAEEVGAPHERDRVFILAKLGHANIGGLQRAAIPYEPRPEDTFSLWTSRADASSERHSERRGYNNHNWPAPLNQPQYDTEPSRVTGAINTLVEGRQDKGKATESQLGRGTDGTRNRMDRLRLLGNGVVPQQAYKAYTQLLTKLSK